MALAEIDSALQALHQAREQQNRIQLFVAQLTNYERLKNPTFRESTRDGGGGGRQLPIASSLTLSHMLAFCEKALVCDSSGSCSLLRGSDEYHPLMTEMQEHVERLRSTYLVGPKSDGGVITLSDLAGLDVVAFFTTALNAARVADSILSVHIAQSQKRLRVGLSLAHVEMDALPNEIVRVNVEPPEVARCLNAAYQGFTSTGSRNILQHVLASKTWLSYIDLSHCVLGDSLVIQDVFPATSQLQHLRVLLLKANNLTSLVVSTLVDILNPSSSTASRNASVSAMVSFPALRCINLNDNLISKSELSEINCAMQSRRLSGGSEVKVMHVDAHGMHAAILARSLMCSCLTDDEYTRWVSSFSVFSGASFGAIVAAALWLGIAPQRIWEFFETLANNVFTDYHYAFYAAAATRKLRSWWTGGNYYSTEALRQALIALFGSETVGMSLKDLSSSKCQGRELMLLAVTSAVPSEETLVAFRSWTITPHASVLPDATSTLNGSPDVSLLDSLLACCAATSMFAPHPLSGSAHSVRDAVIGYPDMVAVELLSRHVTAPVRMQIFLPSEPVAVKDLCDPSTHTFVAARLKAAAAANANGSPQSTLWLRAQQSTMLWADVVQATSMSALDRIATSVAVQPLSITSTFALKRHASGRRNAIRVDEGNMKLFEALDDALMSPCLQ